MSRMWWLLGLLAMAACAGNVRATADALAAAAAAEPVSFTARATDGMPPAVLVGHLHRPDGHGPFPAVVVLHGCAGVGPNQADWARRLVEWDYVALVVDSFGPRGLDGVCADRTLVPPASRAGDALGAAEHLRGLGFVRPDRIGVVGFSHGGSAVLRLVQAGMAEAAGAAPIQAAIAYYPRCDAVSDRATIVPTLVLIGARDDWTPAARCEALRAVLPRPELVAMRFYPDAFHGFDAAAGPRLTAGSGGKLHRQQYDAQAARDAFAQTRAFLDGHLKP